MEKKISWLIHTSDTDACMLMCVSTQLKRAFAYIYTPVRRHSYAYYVRILINVFFSVIEGTWVRSNEKLRVVCIIWKVMNTKNQYTVSTGWNFSYIYLTLTHYERLLWKYIFLVQYFVTINTIKKGIRHLWEIQLNPHLICSRYKKKKLVSTLMLK